jgi:hypothetical protein
MGKPQTANKATTEVALHRMTTDAAMGKPQMAKKATTDVALHRMTTDAAMGKPQTANKATTEVALHKMTTDAADPGTANRDAANFVATLLQFDPTTGGYRVVDAAF